MVVASGHIFASGFPWRAEDQSERRHWGRKLSESWHQQASSLIGWELQQLFSDLRIGWVLKSNHKHQSHHYRETKISFFLVVKHVFCFLGALNIQNPVMYTHTLTRDDGNRFKSSKNSECPQCRHISQIHKFRQISGIDTSSTPSSLIIVTIFIIFFTFVIILIIVTCIIFL